MKNNKIAIFLIITLVIIVIMGCFLYKYTIITDLRWKTMLNDGGSNTSLYYQIDLDNMIVKKIEEEYHANLSCTPSKYTRELYTKRIKNNVLEKALMALFATILSKEDIKDNSYDYFTVLSLDTTKNIYIIVRRYMISIVF